MCVIWEGGTKNITYKTDRSGSLPYEKGAQNNSTLRDRDRSMSVLYGKGAQNNITQ